MRWDTGTASSLVQASTPSLKVVSSNGCLTFQHSLRLPFIGNNKAKDTTALAFTLDSGSIFISFEMLDVFILYSTLNAITLVSSGTSTFKVSHLCCGWGGCLISFVHLVAEITGDSLSYWRHPTHSQKSSSTCSSDPRGSRSLFQNSARWFSPVSPVAKNPCISEWLKARTGHLWILTSHELHVTKSLG